ncbi:MAG: SPOR domain-containing protein [Treponema sp.]|jgi:DedD protein|nr:SPOR domain-containing protein [Treponema sp.]
MEKKKLLLVTISVGVFLVIVIGASILVFSPRNPAPAVMAVVSERPIPVGNPGTAQAVPPGIAGSPVPVAAPQETGVALQVQPATADPADMVRNPGGFQSLQTPPSTVQAVEETRSSINNDTARPGLAERKDGDSTRVVIDVPRPAAPTAAAPTAQAASRPAAAARPAPAAQTTPAARTASSSTAGNTAASGGSTARQTAAAPAKTAAAAAAPARSTPQSRTNNNAYWVQTGSYPTKNQADTAKEILASKGLTAVIENGAVKGEIWYRVRVGPYTSQNEADYWLSLIKTINGKPHIDLASSIVWMSNTR